MKSSLKIIQSLLVIAILHGPHSFAQERERSFTLAINSKYFEWPINLVVELPRGWRKSSQKYKVVYYESSRQPSNLINDYLRPFPVMTVGIDTMTGGYGTSKGGRMYHLSPTEVETISLGDKVVAVPGGTGGGPLLLKCIKEEIIPLIESRYPADSQDRTFMANSAGGLFCYYMLLQPEQPFRNIIASSPGHVNWDNDVLFMMESNLSETTESLPLNLYTTVGSEDIPAIAPPLKRFLEQISSRGYKGLNVNFQVNEGADHYTNKFVSYPMGLKWVMEQIGVEE